MSQSFTPPTSVRDAALRGLYWRNAYGRGGTQIGVARARDLSNGRAVSIKTLKRMKAYFDRHEIDSQAIGWLKGEKGFPSAGRIAWELWGGDAGRKWAESKLKQLEGL